MIDRELILKEFKNYTDNYDPTDPKIHLKICHTYRVAGLCEQIGKSLELSPEDCDLAWTIGMLHDIGRFEQVKRYNTFSDADSVDHAQFGADLLFREGLADRFIKADKDWEDIRHMVEVSIRNHNTYRIAEGLSQREEMFCNIIRDADKIDILRVNIETPVEEIYNVTTGELLEAEVTPEVMAAFNEEHCVLRSLKRSPVDHLVGHISLVYELVFPISLQIVARDGWLDKMMDFKSNNPDTNKCFADIRMHMTDFLSRANKS